MIVRLYGICFALTVFLLAGCVQSDRQQEIEEREKAVTLREQEIAAIESDYQVLLKMRDSLESGRSAVPYTVAVDHSWSEMLQGDWNSKMICQSSRCGNYVIGDQRNELWRFQVDSTGVYVQIINNEKEVRRFKGSYDGQRIALSLVADSTAGVRYNRRGVLDHIGARVVKGTQYLTDQNNCETVFSVELTPREN